MTDVSCLYDTEETTDVYLYKKSSLVDNSKRYSSKIKEATTTATATLISPTLPPQSPVPAATVITNSLNNDTYRRNGSHLITRGRIDGDLNTQDLTPASVSLSVPRWYQLTSLWILLLATIVFFSTAVLITMLDSFTYYQKDKSGCRESYMRPLYLRQVEFDSEMTRFAGKYALYLYREKGVDLSEKPTGVPVLFIPGHAGSYKQIRSIAAESSYHYYRNYAKHLDVWDQGRRNLDFFTVDFNEEFSALHGQSLLEQAEYLNDAIDYILKLYPITRKWHPQKNKRVPDPTSVIILGHSMGGTVARTMFTLHNYQPGSINTIITLSTPHLLPPAPFDWKISKIFDDIHLFWRNGFNDLYDQQQQLHLNGLGTNAPLRPVASAVDTLKDVALISIAGGNLDAIICSDSANVGTFLPPRHGFTVFSTAIPGVWSGMDHVSILSCNQLAKVLAKTLLDIVDVRRSTQTKPLDERIKIMKRALLSGLEDRRGDGSDLNLGELTFHDLMPNQSRFLLPGQRLVLDQKQEHETQKQRTIFLPVYEGADAFSILASHSMGAQGMFDLLLCNKLEPRLKGTIRMGCRTATNDIVVPMPASSSQDTNPASGNTFKFASITFEEMHAYEFLSVIDRRRTGDYDGFLIIEPYDFDTNTRVIEKSMTDIAFGGIQVDINPALYSTVRIPAIESSMLAYHLKMHSQQCSSRHFSPLLRQSISSMHESKFYVNIAGNGERVDMSVHGRTAFSTASPPIRQNQQYRHRDTFQDNTAEGLDISIWMDPTCNQPIKLDISVDWYGSFGRIGFRNGIMLPTFSFIVVIVVWATQIQCYFSTGIYPHFGQGLVFCLRTAFPLITIFLTIASICQGWANTDTYQSLKGSRILDQWWKHYISGSFFHNDSIKSSASIVFNEVLAGRTDLFFWWLPVCGLIVSIGVVCTLWLSTSLFIWLCGSVVTSFTRCYPRAVPQKTPIPAPRPARSSQQQYSYHDTTCNNALLWLIPVPVNCDNDSDRQRMERKVITTLVLFSLVATCIPYQFVFLVAFLVHVITCVRSSMKTWTASASQELKRNNRHHYLISLLLLSITLLPFNAPILVVWIRNLSAHWFVPFSSDHSVMAIAPFMVYIEMLTNQKLMLPRMTSRVWYWFIYCLFYWVVIYAFMYGIKYTHSLYFLSNDLIGCLLFLHFCHSSYGQHMYYTFKDFIYNYSFSKKKS